MNVNVENNSVFVSLAIKVAFVVGSGVLKHDESIVPVFLLNQYPPVDLILRVLGDEVVHVGLGLGELHLVHALPRVPMEEGLPTEHRRELLRDPLEQLLRT